MEENEVQSNKQKNSNLSVALIFANLILAVLFFSATGVEKSEETVIYLATGFLVLQGGYAFTYHGKGYRVGKWLFAIALVIALSFYGLMWYATQLGKAFAH